eukprot:4445921-Pyramimonas_sp.AAC.1
MHHAVRVLNAALSCPDGQPEAWIAPVTLHVAHDGMHSGGPLQREVWVHEAVRLLAALAEILVPGPQLV